MRNITVLGAGRSSGSLIEYLLKYAVADNYTVTVADADVSSAQAKINGHSSGIANAFDAAKPEELQGLVASADLLISLLPPDRHAMVARACLQEGKHLITASYVSDEIQQMGQMAVDKGILILMECGLDPGIDHMSAKEMIDALRAKGAKLTSFRSYTGGLIAPESDNNPWHYKVTWNPRNVVLAGQGTAKYKRNNLYKYVPYHQLFGRLDRISVPGYGDFEGYLNRDSLKYRSVYDIEDIPTIVRGTLRRPGFCAAWNVLVQLGATDDSYVIEQSDSLTYREFINLFLLYKPNDAIEKKVADYTGVEPDGQEMEMLTWLGVFESQKIGIKQATPAMILQKLLEEKLKLEPNDRDMIVMQHQFEYLLENKMKLTTASLVVKGDKHGQTAMAKTVGLPMGIAARQLLKGSIKSRGVVLPTLPELYIPILQELLSYEVRFIVSEKDLVD